MLVLGWSQFWLFSGILGSLLAMFLVILAWQVAAVAPGAGLPTGTVVFTVNGATLGTPVTLVGGQATSSSFASLSPGTYTIKATYSGDGNFLGSAGLLDQGLARTVYTANFLRTLRAKVVAKARRFPGFVDVTAVRRARTFAAYDRAVTAPLHGFADEHVYWARSSSRPYLARIAVPTLLLGARDDPFVPPDSLPDPGQLPTVVRAEFSARGGHAESRRQAFVPVSNAVTGAMSAFGAPSFRCWSRNGRRMVWRK